MTRREEFARVRKKGKSAATRHFVMATLADPSLPHLKLGLITSRQVGKAVTRNKIRRRLRSIVSKHGDKLDSRRYIVLIARRRAAEASFQQLEGDWLRLADQLGILQE